MLHTWHTSHVTCVTHVTHVTHVTWLWVDPAKAPWPIRSPTRPTVWPSSKLWWNVEQLLKLWKRALAMRTSWDLVESLSVASFPFHFLYPIYIDLSFFVPFHSQVQQLQQLQLAGATLQGEGNERQWSQRPFRSLRDWDAADYQSCCSAASSTSRFVGQRNHLVWGRQHLIDHGFSIISLVISSI